MIKRCKKLIPIFLVSLLLLSACSNDLENQDPVPPQTSNNAPSNEETAKDIQVLGVKHDAFTTQALVLEDGRLVTYDANLVENTLTLAEATDTSSEGTSMTHPIDGYLSGSIQWHHEDNKLSVVFLDPDSSKHLDLWGFELEDDQTVWHLNVSDDFTKIHYQLLGSQGLASFVHHLDINITDQIDADNYGIIFSKEGQVGHVYHEEGMLFTINWLKADAQNDMTGDDVLYDVVIDNGIVMDPETNTMKFGYNIGIIDDKIKVITKAPLLGEQTIDATGLIVSPGFIDMLSFNLNSTSDVYKVMDGVTTALSMHGCTEDFAGFFRQYERNPVHINYGGAIFAIRLRFELGLGGSGRPTDAQIDHMAERVRQEINAGGLALAFSPEYYPGTISEEISRMMSVAAEYNIPTHFHSRYSAVQGEFTGIDGVHEVLDYGRNLNAKVHFMHLHSTGGTAMMDEALEAIHQARSEGVKVSFDIYPYDFWMSSIQMARFSPGWQERYDISYNDLQMAGTSERLTEETFNYYRSVGGLCAAFAMNEDEIIQALLEHDVMIGSDATISSVNKLNSHPRGAGSFSKIIGRYVRDENHFTLMEGLRKMTINSVLHLEDISQDMALRGRLQEDKIADITLFDYWEIIDRATIENPAITSEGIKYVLVSGNIVVEDGVLNNTKRHGKPIKSDYAR